MQDNMLEINDLHVSFEEKDILNGINFTLPKGEIHALMGPNGSGKSTLAMTLAGNPKYLVKKGAINFLNESLLSLSPEERATLGLFLAFQNPIELPGVANNYFIRTSLNSIRHSKELPDIAAEYFLNELKSTAKQIGMEETLLSRGVNHGFSGGEKKCNEILQMLMLNPKLIILDEIDSGLDIDILKRISQIIIKQHHPEQSILIITHYPRLLEYLPVHQVNIIKHGKIVLKEGPEIVKKLEAIGYEGIENEQF